MVVDERRKTKTVKFLQILNRNILGHASHAKQKREIDVSPLTST